MGEAQRLQTGATPTLAEQDLAPAVASQIADSVRQVLDTADVQKIATFLKGYGGDHNVVMRYLQEKHGNRFCEMLVAEQKKQAEPSAWDKLLKDGKLKLVEGSKAADEQQQQQPAQEATPTPTGEVSQELAGVRDLATRVAGTSDHDLGSKSIGAKKAYIDRKTDIDHSHATTTVQNNVADADISGTGSAKANAAEGLSVKGNANASAHLVGTSVAIHSKPMSHELFGETVSAQFHLGVSAHTYAEAKGNLGVNVGWTGFGATADITGVSTSGNAEVTGAASLNWTKKSPAAYAQKMMGNGSWRQLLAKYLPSWVLATLPESRVQGWMQSLIELLISNSSGDQVVLGASTSANARASLGLPGLAFKGGALAVQPGAGLSFGGANANVELQLGKDPGLELLTMLAFGGTNAMFDKLAPNFSIAKFLEQKLDASLDKEGDDHDVEETKPKNELVGKMAALRDKAKSLDGKHSKEWKAGQQANGDDLKAEGHDFTLTRDKTGTVTRTGDDARKHAAEESSKPAVEPKKPGKLRELAEKAVGDATVTLAKTDQRYSKTAIDKTTKKFDVLGAEGEASGRALELESNATGELKAGAKGISVAGNANASAYLMGGQVQIATPDMPFTLMGEQLHGKVAVSVDAGAFAQVGGNVGLDVGFSGAGMNASLSGFAGVKAGITASGSLTWSRKPASYYTNQLVQTGAWKTLFGTMLPQWVLNRAPDKYVRQWLENLIELLVNGNGDALVLGAVARGEGSAGIGAAGAFSAKFQGGVLHCHGRGGITFGLGAGATADLSLGVTDGMAMLGVMALRGGTDLFNMLQPQMQMMSYLRPLFAQMRNRELEPKKPA